MTAATVRDSATRTRTVRFYDDAWDRIGARSRDRSPFIREMAEAGIDAARCYRCLALVPVEFGDLTGKPLAEWVAEAQKTVTRQHRDGHHPVTVGNGHDTAEPPQAVPVASDAARCGEPVRGGIGAPPDPCGLPEGHSGQHRGAASYSRKLQRETGRHRHRALRSGAEDVETPRTEPPAPVSAVFPKARCGEPIRPWKDAAAGTCGRPAGHSGAHRSGASYQKIVDRSARVREQNRGASRAEPPRPAPGTVTFLEPGGSPRVAAPVPEVPAARNKKGRRT